MASNLNAPNIVPRYRPNAIRIGEHIRQVVFFNAYRTQSLEDTGRTHNFAADILCTGASGLCLCNEPWRKSVLTTDLQVSISQRYRDFYLRVVPYPAEEVLVICVFAQNHGMMYTTSKQKILHLKDGWPGDGL
jgi:hypothetical protein